MYRAQNPLDRRSNLIYLTEKGKGLQKRLIEIVTHTMEDAVSEIDEADLNNCLQVLNKISSTILKKIK